MTEPRFRPTTMTGAVAAHLLDPGGYDDPFRPADHDHECRDCGGSIYCGLNSEDCDDIPNNGQCDDCAVDDRMMASR